MVSALVSGSSRLKHKHKRKKRKNRCSALFTLLHVLCASSLPLACANACAVDAPITVMLMLNRCSVSRL